MDIRFLQEVSEAYYIDKSLSSKNISIEEVYDKIHTLSKYLQVEDPLLYETIYDSSKLTQQGYIYGYLDLVLEQNNRCKLCGTDIPGDKRKHFTVDHDHQTGKVRGLLCSKCNQGLGCFKDQKDLLVKAILYLDEGDNNGREEELDKRCYQEARCPNCASEEGW